MNTNEEKEVPYDSGMKDRVTGTSDQLKGSGFIPCAHLVVILPDPVQRASAGGIEFTEELINRNEMAQIFGVVVSVGNNVWFDEPIHRAVVGDRVMFAKFRGELFTGSDGKRYRVMNDKDILGLIIAEGVRK
ncbi:MAG: hypothetical protein ACREQ5_27570 [Candidatus Dormibacteria bacterium]